MGTAKQKFEAYITAIADKSLAELAHDVAWDNSFAKEVHNEYRNDEHRYEAAFSTAEMVVDCPSDYTSAA